jgi:hypothetical protein
VNNIGSSWAEIKESTVHGFLKQLCPDLMQDFKGFEETLKMPQRKMFIL